MALGAAVQAATLVGRGGRPAGQVSPELEKIFGDGSAQFPPWARALSVPMAAYMIVHAIMEENAVGARSPAAHGFGTFRLC